MANYVKTTDFASKDSLATGNPNKVASGTQVDTEFNNIATAIATKEDLSKKGIANGYASLDTAGKVPDTQLSANVSRNDASNTFTGSNQTISASAPRVSLHSTTAAADAKRWHIQSSSTGTLLISTRTDADGTGNNAVSISRTGITVDSIAVTATNVTVNGTNVRNASLFNTGTLANSVVAASNVTQHQAALSIAETQIPDGSIFPRLGSAETITGAWKHTSSPGIEVESSSPSILLDNTGASTNNKSWLIRATTSQWILSTATDAAPTTAVNDAIRVSRTTTTVGQVTFPGSGVTVSGTLDAGGVITSQGSAVLTNASMGPGHGLNADMVDGFHADASNTPATVVVRDGVGHVYVRNINASDPVDDVTAVQGVVYSTGGDNFYRRASIARVRRQLFLNCVIQADPGTVPTGQPGDVFFYY